MITIGIEIDKNKAICFVLEKDASGSYINRTGKFKYLVLKDDKENSQVRDFQSTIFTFFNERNPDSIALLSRQSKGEYASSPLSFKIEGLIQCYTNYEVEIISPQTVTAFFKKNPLSVTFDHKYQERAARLANFLIDR